MDGIEGVGEGTEMELSFEALRRVQLQEKNHAGLQALPADFFDAYAGFLREQKSRLKEHFSLDAMRLYENTVKVLRDVAERRASKIVLKALADARGAPGAMDGLARQEKDLYTSLFQTFQRHASVLDADVFGAPRAPARAVSVPEPAPAPVPVPAPAAVFVKFSSDVPAFVSADGVERGPYAAGDVASVMPAEARVLVRRGVAVEVGEGESRAVIADVPAVDENGDGAADNEAGAKAGDGEAAADEGGITVL